MNNEQYPLLFACNLAIKGANRALLCDVQRQIYQYIPLSMYAVLTENKGKTLAEIKAAYDNEHDDIIDEYFEELTKEEWTFFTDTPQYFPEMSLFWEEPTVLTNAIIDINEEINFDFDTVFEQLSELGCEHILIRCFSEKTLSYFQAIMDEIGTKRIVSLELIACFQSDWTKNILIKFCENNPRVATFTAYSAPESKVIHLSEHQMGNVIFCKDVINSAIHCGKIAAELFTTNVKTFTEAQQHNTCLNRKISIDTEGYIRNCPSMPEHYGNIKDTTLQDALQHPDFKKYWFVNKDQISVCKDCEFRYICTDCRAYRENPEDMYSKPLKCGYNPYTCEWEEWSTNPLKQKAIDYYGMKALVKNLK